MPAGYKPQGSSLPYDPQRDIAYIGPTLIKTALDVLFMDRLTANPQMAMFIEQHNITQEQINDAVVAIAEAQKDFVSVVEADKVKTPYEALQRLHFFDYPLPLRLLVFGCVGECLFGAYFQAVRDVTFMNEDSPASKEIAHLLYAARTMAGKDPTGENIKVDEYGARIIELQQQLQNRDAKITELEQEKTSKAGHIRRANDQVAQVQQELIRLQDELATLKDRSIWQVMRDCFKRKPLPTPTNS